MLSKTSYKPESNYQIKMKKIIRKKSKNNILAIGRLTKQKNLSFC